MSGIDKMRAVRTNVPPPPASDARIGDLLAASREEEERKKRVRTLGEIANDRFKANHERWIKQGADADDADV